MKRRITLTSPERAPAPTIFYASSSRGNCNSITIEGDFEVENKLLTRFVEVTIFAQESAHGWGPGGVSPHVTWTYIDNEAANGSRDLCVGDLVFVPFGWNDRVSLARVEKAGQDPAYTGPGTIKIVSRRAQIGAA